MEPLAGKAMMAYSASDIARALEGSVVGDGNSVLTGFAPAEAARSGDLTFAENEAFFRQAEQSAAAAILIDRDYRAERKVLIRVANARVAFAKVLPMFFPEPDYPAGLHPTAIVSPSARIDSTAHVGPYCTIEDQVEIGPRAVIQAGCAIGSHSVLGEATHLFPRVTVYPRSRLGKRVRIHSGSVIGADGFGYVLDGGQHRKIPQVGEVVIHDDVEIGAGVTIDRGTIGPTVIGRGAKIDNLVQIAHNVVIGDYSIVVAQTGIAGSTQLGDHVTLAGQVGLAGHLRIGNRATVGAQSGVMHNIPEGEMWLGSPARPGRQMKRQILAAQRLPELMKRWAELERHLKSRPGPSNP